MRCKACDAEIELSYRDVKLTPWRTIQVEEDLCGACLDTLPTEEEMMMGKKSLLDELITDGCTAEQALLDKIDLRLHELAECFMDLPDPEDTKSLLNCYDEFYEDLASIMRAYHELREKAAA